MKNRIALITGSTDGVGRAVAEKLAAQGALVLVHGRNQKRAESLLEAIRRRGGRARFYPADFSSLAEVKELAAAVAREHERLDLLINNVGIGAGRGSRRELSSDGLELRFAVNYLAGFLLTRQLLPLLKASAPARIVNVASVGQQAIDFKDVMLEHGYSGQLAYCQSKLAQILFTFDLAEELAGTGVTVTCLHPATFMDTAMVREAGVSPLSSVEDGAQAILNLAVSPQLETKTGLYFNETRESRANAQAYDRQARDRLRALSVQLTGLNAPAFS